MKRTILSIDPGASGGFALLGPTGIVVQAMPDTEGDIIELLVAYDISAGDGEKIAVVESQTGIVGPHIKISAASMFTFGNGYGFIRGVLQALGWRMEHVRPMAWQKALSLGTKKSHGTPTMWKNHCKQMAQRLYPGIHITLKTADALLILEYYLLRTTIRTEKELEALSAGKPKTAQEALPF